MTGVDRTRIITYLACGAVVLFFGVRTLGGITGEGQSEPMPLRIGQRSPEALPERMLVVDVAGGVESPGVYRLVEGSRVIDAIRKAGGPSRDAAPGGINRAALLVDGQQVVVPVGPVTSSGAPSMGPSAGQGPVSLGSATVTDLVGIDGIGPVTARKIIEFRDSRGGLSGVDDLDQVSGIGPVTMESLRSALQP